MEQAAQQATQAQTGPALMQPMQAGASAALLGPGSSATGGALQQGPTWSGLKQQLGMLLHSFPPTPRPGQLTMRPWRLGELRLHPQALEQVEIDLGGEAGASMQSRGWRAERRAGREGKLVAGPAEGNVLPLLAPGPTPELALIAGLAGGSMQAALTVAGPAAQAWLTADTAARMIGHALLAVQAGPSIAFPAAQPQAAIPHVLAVPTQADTLGLGPPSVLATTQPEQLVLPAVPGLVLVTEAAPVALVGRAALALARGAAGLQPEGKLAGRCSFGGSEAVQLASAVFAMSCIWVVW